MADDFCSNNWKGGIRTNKKVLFGIFSVFAILILTAPMAFADGQVCFQKSIWCGPTTVPLNTNVQWLIAIEFYTTIPLEDVEIKDRLGAELEIDLPFPESITQGTVSYYTNGGSDKVFLTWDVGDVPAYTYVALTFWVSTDINPAGHQEYTSPGCYALNSGATMKYYYMGVKYSLTTGPIFISVVEQ